MSLVVKFADGGCLERHVGRGGACPLREQIGTRAVAWLQVDGDELEYLLYAMPDADLRAAEPHHERVWRFVGKSADRIVDTLAF